MRHPPSQAPRNGPWRRIACAVYSEQLGSNRQARPNHGARASWYTRIRPSMQRVTMVPNNRTLAVPPPARPSRAILDDDIVVREPVANFVSLGKLALLAQGLSLCDQRVDLRLGRAAGGAG